MKTELHFLYPETESSPDVLSTNLKHHVGLGMSLHELASFLYLDFTWPGNEAEMGLVKGVR